MPAAEGDVAPQPTSPIIADVNTAATIQPLFLFDNNRRTRGRRARSATVTEADQPGEDTDGGGGAAPPAHEPPAIDGPDIAILVSLRENMETAPFVRWNEPREPR
jgi:hypothetical protein